MKCPYDEPDCPCLDNGNCDIGTCYDEYDIAQGIPPPSKEVHDYWKELLKEIKEGRK